MPKIFEDKGYKFFFFSNEGEPLEPAHVHVRKGSHIAKFWLEPGVKLANSWGFKAHELKAIGDIVKYHRKSF